MWNANQTGQKTDVNETNDVSEREKEERFLEALNITCLSKPQKMCSY